MSRIKEIINLILGSKLQISSSGRTFAKVPLWLVVLVGLSSIRLAVLTAVLVVAFGLTPELVKA